MSFILFSSSCYIEGNVHDVRISMEKKFPEDAHSTCNDKLLTNDNFQFKFGPDNNLISIHIELKLLNNEKKDSFDQNAETIPRILLLNKVINIERNETLRNESTQIKLNYIEILENFLWTVKHIEMEMNLMYANEFYSILSENLLKIPDRPRNLLVFVNPQCGKREGNSVYDEKVLPLFEQSNINVKTISTERANHARDYIKENLLDDYDGIICVGGDGMFSEISCSLLSKTQEQSHLNINEKNIQLNRPSIRLGVIPAGSTDALVFGTTGHNDPVTSALQILTGQSIFLDITTVHNENGFERFMFTTLAYGFFGDIIQQSEQWRFFGPARYNLSGIAQFLRNRSYHVQLKLTQPNEKYSSKTLVQNLVENTPQQSSPSSSSQIKLEGEYRTISCLNMPCRCEKSKYGMSPSVHLGDGSFDVILVKRSWKMGLLRFLTNVANDGRTIDHLPNVERYHATEVVINPIINREEDLGHWACDGELIQTKHITIRAHQQILPLFASGINIQQVQTINQIQAD